ncbi:MAG: hypothetical protein K0R54_2082 [Clostridiaceae bacterium]|jgi:hypothetical protein|nr:hypothetical protein [Clostridiaceae bacterium]
MKKLADIFDEVCFTPINCRDIFLFIMILLLMSIIAIQN